MRKRAFRSIFFVWAPLGAVAVLDHYTVPNMSMLLLYMIPVVYAVMRIGIRWGLMAAFVAGAATFFAEGLEGIGWTLAAWNAATRLAALVLIVSLLHTTSRIAADSGDG